MTYFQLDPNVWVCRIPTRQRVYSYAELPDVGFALLLQDLEELLSVVRSKGQNVFIYPLIVLVHLAIVSARR